MELGDDSVDENVRYAFLLGSALRNNDADQFLQVYDTIIPKNLAPETVAELKDRARILAAFPESEYAELVHQVRGFSVAQQPAQELPLSGPSLLVCSSAMDRRPDISALSRTSRHINQDDIDSGICDKTTSASTEECDCSEMERVAVLKSYRSTSPVPKNRISLIAKANSTRVACMACDSDEEGAKLAGQIVKATSRFDDDLRGTDMQDATEMDTYRYQESSEDNVEDDRLVHEYDNMLTRQSNDAKFDEALSCDSDNRSDDGSALEQHLSSDDSLASVNVNKQYYPDGNSCCIAMDPASDEEDLKVSEHQKQGTVNFNNPQSYAASRNYGTCSNVDSTVSFFENQPSSSQGVKRPVKKTLQPPFDFPLSEDKLSQSLEPLLNKSRDGDVSNMPLGAPIRPSPLSGAGLSDSDNKKKKRKKKKTMLPQNVSFPPTLNSNRGEHPD
ncbi:hypothetical protein CAPTEDRAFT_208999 [Capitella teleta]|uniref:Uncharacterized protein n=1 Tax=Capitella teleta TaxID=283909 RepID=R7U4G2_CAPTE|nr:hypothetical protein CAPTEDRAFT_208999 [Capitella teleta]|eukprot:ELT98576.1 hypothetical protein CAPTEDRAFT_208999 [Capitella teleta]